MTWDNLRKVLVLTKDTNKFERLLIPVRSVEHQIPLDFYIDSSRAMGDETCRIRDEVLEQANELRRSALTTSG